MQTLLARGAGHAAQGSERLSVALRREGVVVDGAWESGRCYFSSGDRAASETQRRRMEPSLTWKGGAGGTQRSHG